MSPIYPLQARYLMVEEPVTQQFVEDELPQLSRHLCMNVLKMTALPNKLKRQGQNVSDFEYVLVSTKRNFDLTET